MQRPVRNGASSSGARHWAPLARFIEAEARIGAWAERRRATLVLYEFTRFGIKQGWACLFGALMLALLIGTHLFYPQRRLRSPATISWSSPPSPSRSPCWPSSSRPGRRRRSSSIFHVVGTAMEIFKTSVGSWIYPEASILRIGGVPLFTGFMYAAIGSYIARCWRLFDFRFTHHPPLWALVLLARRHLRQFLRPPLRAGRARAAVRADRAAVRPLLGAFQGVARAPAHAAAAGLRAGGAVHLARREHRHLHRRLDVPQPAPRLGSW